MDALRMFHPFTRVSHVSPDSGTCRGLWFGVLFGWLLLVFPPLLVCFASARDVLTSFFSDTVLDDRQCFHARSASRLKKGGPSFSGLVRHVYDELHPYLTAKEEERVTLNAFVTFIVGPPDHQNARYALHSHLVGCHTTSTNDMHVDYSTLYIPIGPGHPWAGPEEWGPLMVFIAAGLLWPDLSFLVCHPRFLLGAHAPLDELRDTLATHCPMLLFSSASELTRSDVLYHPGQVSKFAHNPPYSKIAILIRCELVVALQPINRRPNISSCVHIG